MCNEFKRHKSRSVTRFVGCYCGNALKRFKKKFNDICSYDRSDCLVLDSGLTCANRVRLSPVN